MREKDGKYYAATGSKGYRWLESEMVTELGKEADIDRSYYDDLVNEAVKSISKFGDFEWFVSDEPYVKKEQDIPPWELPCGNRDCVGCEFGKILKTVDGKLTCEAGYEMFANLKGEK